LVGGLYLIALVAHYLHNAVTVATTSPSTTIAVCYVARSMVGIIRIRKPKAVVDPKITDTPICQMRFCFLASLAVADRS
jgi:hypothetical protein